MKNIFPFLICLIIGCSSPPQNDDSLLTIDIEKAFNNAGDILLSDFLEEIEYIPLETLRECVTGEYLRVFATDDYIIAIAFHQNYLFDRKTGKFIREIGRYGQGPNEYRATHIAAPFDENRKTIRSNGFQKNDLEYDLEGHVVRKISYPNELPYDWWLIAFDENRFIMYKKNQEGNDPYKLHLFDDKGNVLNRFPNHHSFIANRNSSYGTCVFYKWKNEVFFYENCVDTLYKVTENELTPYYRFQLGKYNPPYSEKQNLPWPSEKPMCNRYFDFQTINESDRFLFFAFRHDKKDLKRRNGIPRNFGFYDKETGIAKISEIDHTERSPVINNVDDFAPIYPFLWSINQSGELITYMEAEEIIEWFKDNPEKAKKLPKHLQELSKLKIDDNQVIVIAKLKK